MCSYKRIVFLDIDGCLASIPFLMKRKGYIDPEKCKLLNTLKNYNVEIVISSSWGYDEGRTEKALKDCGLELPIIGYTDHFHVDWMCRGNEIEKWLIENFKGLGTKYGFSPDGVPYYRHRYGDEQIDYEFVIIDDDTDFLLGQKNNFIHIDRETGITEKDIEKIIDILIRKD